MFKLLTDESKEKVRREYLLRRTVVSLWALVFVLAVALAGLFPTYILSNARQIEIAERAKLLENAPEGEEENLQAWLSGLNTKLRLLSPKLDRNYALSAIDKALKERGSGVSITAFNWKKGEGAGTLALSGIARDRQSLLSLESRLNASGEFIDVMLPVSNLAKERDISFQFKLTPKPNQ